MLSAIDKNKFISILLWFTILQKKVHISLSEGNEMFLSLKNGKYFKNMGR